MKALIPVAGAGVNLRPHTYTQPKPLIPVAGKPIISYIIDQLVESGIHEFIFVIGYLGDKIRTFLETAYPEISKSYVVQHKRRGLGHAILMARDELLKTEELIILLGDTILDLNMDQFLKIKSSALAIQKVADPRQFGVVETNSKGVAVRVVEKPSIPTSNNAIVGLYKIKEIDLLIQSLEEVDQIANEKETDVHLTDALMKMIQKKVVFHTMEVKHWYDCGKKEILLQSNRELLKERVSDVGTQFVYEDTIIIPPVVHGESCSFKNAIIGPNVALGQNVKIENSLVSDSILGDYVEISGTVLSASVIGNDAVIRGLSQSLNIGDNNEIDFSR